MRSTTLQMVMLGNEQSESAAHLVLEALEEDDRAREAVHVLDRGPLIVQLGRRVHGTCILTMLRKKALAEGEGTRNHDMI